MIAESCGGSGAAIFDAASGHLVGSWRRSHADESTTKDVALGAAFVVHLYEPRYEPSADVLRISELAAQALVEREAARREVRQFVRNAQASHEVTREISSLTDREQVHHLVVARCRELMHCDLAGIAFADHSRENVTWRAVDGSRLGGVARTGAVTVGGVSARAIRTGRPVVIDDFDLDAGDLKPPGTLSDIEGLAAVIVVPLQLRKSPAGCLLIGHRRAYRFTNEEIMTFNDFAAQVEVAVENADLYERARRERALMHSVVESIDDGLLLVDNDDRVAHVNRRAEELFRIHRRDVVGTKVGEALASLCGASAQPDELRAVVLGALRSQGRAPAVDVTLQLEPLVEVRVASFEPVNASGKAIGRVVLFRDVTIERNVDALKTDVIAIVSHELRSPLSSIRGCTTALLDDGAGRDAALQRSYLEMMDRESARLVELLSNLTDASLIDAGVFRVDLQASDPVALARRVASRKAGRVVVDATALRAPLLFDHRRIEQVLDNLVDNALKYSDERAPVTISFDDRRDEVVVTVEDEGAGVPVEQRRHVFERFYRIDGVRRKGDGTGLGLFICRGIVEAHGGRIWLEANRPRGTRVRFSVPRAMVLA